MGLNWFDGKRPLIIGHRGASDEAPENTLAAFALAKEQGADGIELDVHLSADGKLVVIHDADLSRTTNGTGFVSQYTLAELKQFDAGMGQQIPTLDEVFELCGPRFLYNIEVKDYGWRDKGTETAVADRIQSHNLESVCLVSSFNPLSVRRARKQLTRTTPVAVIRMNKGWMRYTHWLMPGAEADHPHRKMVTEAYMAWAKKRGYLVNTWTVNEPEEARQLARLGVNALITNCPALIRKALELD
ncbi:MAG: glycerophosphodiester phosphodiesterase [Candidatus Promineifilaceae bacterium]